MHLAHSVTICVLAALCAVLSYLDCALVLPPIRDSGEDVALIVVADANFTVDQYQALGKLSPASLIHECITVFFVVFLYSLIKQSSTPLRL